MLAKMEIDECEQVDKEKSLTCSCVANLSSLSDYHDLDQLEAHEDTGSKWNEDGRCRFSPTKNTPVDPCPCAEWKQLF